MRAIHHSQPRVFLFTIALSGSRARLLRWDRAGCIVTESFDIRDDPETLCEFLWRFSQTSDAGRGHDTTVKLALPEEEGVFSNAIADHVRSQITEGEDVDKAVKQHYQPGKLYVVHGENNQRYLFSRPIVSPQALAGRGTRGYWAVDAATRKVVFLKDTWRRGSVEEVEGSVLRRLLDAGVRYIPTLVWHGDVLKDCARKEHELTGECC